MKLLFTLSMTIISLYGFATPLQPPHELYKEIGGGKNNPGYYPYIGHYDFRRVSNHIIDQNIIDFDPDVVSQGDIIYVNVWYLPWFEKHVHDQIKHPYILVSGDVGSWLPDPGAIKKLLYDPKLAAWFCRNLLFSYHPKLFQIPMGQDLDLFGCPVDELRDSAAKRPFIKKHLLSMNFLPRPWGDRDKIMQLFENEPYCFSRIHSGYHNANPVSRSIFYEDLGASQFTLSPIGLEWDCVRTWEAWIFDCIPIVEHSFIDPVYDGLPTLFVHEWKEINENFLKEQYEKLKGQNCDRAYFDYWHQKLKDIQAKVKNNDLFFTRLEATQFEKEDIDDLSKILSRYNRKKCTVIYKGSLVTARSLQILNKIPRISTIFLHDPWMNKENFQLFSQHLTDTSLLKNNKKLQILQSEAQFNQMLTNVSNYSLFLDLTYQRHSLLRDFNNFRHRLKQDLKEISQSLPCGTLVCGNMAHYPYVKESLSRFSKENNIPIEIQGNFWFFTRE